MSDAKTTSNAGSMTNAQGEFKPRKGGSEPLTTSGHQPGQIVSEEDTAPEFSAQTLPPGSAPASNTFRPNPVNEVPGQAGNPHLDRSHGKESVRADPLDMPGATSGDVHTGLGHPGSGQTSTELKNEGKHTSKRQGGGLTGLAEGGSGIAGNGKNAEFRKLADDRGFDQHGTATERGADGTVAGTESQGIVSSEALGAERSVKERQDRST